MNKAYNIKAPSSKERFTVRIMILLGLLSVVYFFYWFLNPKLIEDKFLFWILIFSIAYDSLKTIYIWYHYWDISIPVKPVGTSNFSVDVLTTYFPGEPYEMVKKTLLAIQNMEYPHTTYLCDEANDAHLKEFCLQNNIIHVTRNNRINAKAGNINNALIQAKGEICLILDPDHNPSPDFLTEVIPYFEDETIGFVQTVQAYYNINESAVAKGAAEQTFHFYGPVMMSMNSYGTVNAIGANCVFRRKALDSIGGHAAGLSEDMHTAMQLHAKGWKSIYVPKVFTKGLSPASLTSYYKQQLKWSRGTLELLVSVYPKLFWKFSWRQKLHYGILPFHYLSGIVFLISFLIPIISLFTATTPWKGNVEIFGLLFLPVFVSIVGIRFYVQRWVMYKSERGVHLTGGLLQLCTWWIYIIGFIYTIIRKKVPYLPTPKEDKDRTSWKILLPNILVGVFSIVAVFYGLSIDFTPFSIFMSGFALLNAFFMFYTIFFAFQKQKSIPFHFETIRENVSVVKRLQNYSFQISRKSALPLIFLVFATSIYIRQDIEYEKWGGISPEIHEKHLINYLGVFAPKNDNGITALQKVKKMSSQIGENFDIVSFYIPWEKDVESKFPKALLDSVYKQKSIPMITWEPWLNSFKSELKDNKHVFELISEGYFDTFISDFALKIRQLHRPVFFRFAHEFDNPFYPWYLEGEKAPFQFKMAWIHTYEIFKKSGAENVIWVWNPCKPENVTSFYPGVEYVDWIGVNILNYGTLNLDKKWHNFKELYEPFHTEFQSLPTTPVIISEFGTLKDSGNQAKWINDAFNSFDSEFNEIKSVIYFDSKVDNNWPHGFQNGNLDWTISTTEVVKKSFDGKEVPDYVFSLLSDPVCTDSDKMISTVKIDSNIKGINLKKGHDWRKDYHVLSRKNLISDFEKMKKLGINTVKFEGNSVYEHNVLHIAKEIGLNISYGFWIPADLDFINDTIQAGLLKSSIIEKIIAQKKSSQITSWNIQNDVLYNQKNFYQKPELIFQNHAYLGWLKDLVQRIKKIDPVRPLIIDLEVNRQTIHFSKMLKDCIPEIDALGLVVKEKKDLNQTVEYLQLSGINFIFSDIEVEQMLKLQKNKNNSSFFIAAWQDAHESNRLNFSGITDRKGRYKADYFRLKDILSGTKSKIKSPVIRILRPAFLVNDHKILDYYAMHYDSMNGWKYGEAITDLKFEWSLIRCDKYGNFMAIKDIGTSAKMSVEIPSDHDSYKLLLTTSKGDTIYTTITTLNTPLKH